MRELSIRTRSDGHRKVPGSTIDAFSHELRGTLLRSGDQRFEEARTVWNAMVDRHPALIARCAVHDDVVRCIRFAADHDLLLAVKGGGHNIAGNGVCDGGFVIDLSAMRTVEVDPQGRTARVEAGATLGDFDRAAQEHALATPLGINSTTGVAGLTLGGGFGWLTRRYGMSADNLIAVDVVTADGASLRASDSQHADLFWGLRGGGGNLAVATAFHFRLHPVGPEVLCGLIVHPFADAERVLRRHQEFALRLPDETTVWAVLRKAPPLPFLPAEWHGRDVVVLAAFHAGDVPDGERLLRPLRDFGDPIADVIGPKPYTAWQQAFDPLLTPGARNYWKSHHFRTMGDDALAILVDHAGRLPSAQTEIFIGQLGGAMSSIPPAATAFPHRDARFIMNVHGRWEDPAQDDACIAWARDFFSAMAPFATGGAYVNFMTDDEGDRLTAAYGDNYGRLLDLKRRYDPDNMFRVNQNIRPVLVM